MPTEDNKKTALKKAQKARQGKQKQALTGYEKLVIVFLVFLQITVVIDFVVISPLGVMIIGDLKISSTEFGEIVSAYAFSAALAAFLSAGFADRFDRKKLLLFFYGGFLIGTLLCGLSFNYLTLVLARAFTGFFGGVLGAVTFAIVTDLFAYEKRGLVMGWLQSAFSASQILGIPIGIFIANHLGWKATFLSLVVVSAVVGIFIGLYLKPVRGHLSHQKEKNPFKKMGSTLFNRSYLISYLTIAFLMTGGFMIMPFSSTFLVNNLGLSLELLPYLYVFSGLASLAWGPIIGMLADRFGKYFLYVIGSLLTITIEYVFTSFTGQKSFLLLTLMGCLIFIGVTTRNVTISALNSAVPELKDRGAFMNITSALQMVSGGLASVLAGNLVTISATGQVNNFYLIGIAVVIAGLISTVSGYPIHLRAKLNQLRDKRRQKYQPDIEILPL